MIIPYTTERRADTGVTNVTMGMWLFIASEVMLFGALFSAYALLRSAATDWPSGRQVLNLTLGAANTAVVLTLTTLVWLARRRPTSARPLLMLSSILAGVFIGFKAFEYRHDYATGLLPNVNTFLGMYFTLTGLHLAHVIAGVIGNGWIMASAAKVGDAMTAGRLQSLAIYWTFVDVVWLVIFVLFYLS